LTPRKRPLLTRRASGIDEGANTYLEIACYTESILAAIFDGSGSLNHCRVGKKTAAYTEISLTAYTFAKRKVHTGIASKTF
jgi:hypothetical protein